MKSEVRFAMENWTVDDVCQFLRKNDFEEKVIQAFKVNKVRGRVLPLLNDEDLKQLELAALGDRKYLQHLLSSGCRKENEVNYGRWIIRLKLDTWYCIYKTVWLTGRKLRFV